VRWAGPVLVFERLADVRAYAEPLPSPDARLEYHRLRYAVEFFEEVLKPAARDVIEALKELQDHLGNLQDAVVACGMVRGFLTWGTWGPPVGKERTVPSAPVNAPGVATYLAARQSELQELVGAVPWPPLRSPAATGARALVVRFSAPTYRECFPRIPCEPLSQAPRRSARPEPSAPAPWRP